MKSLFVPEATAASAQAPDASTARWLRLHKQHVGSHFVLSLLPAHIADYWHASNSDPDVAEIDKKLLSDGTALSVKVIADGQAIIDVTGKKNETVVITIDTQQ
ncbi:MAG TPA: hypothetical protein VKB39_06230 [Candidatus Baltobacteraceae bacterium]|nr:hypothetical protein [Candidatus Baltobacteraceae bacterium]